MIRIHLNSGHNGESMDSQIGGAAYHKVLELRVDREVLEKPWILVRKGEVIARSHHA